MGVLGALCALLAAAAGLLLAVVLRLWLQRPRCDIPGPTTLPLLGNVLFFRKLPIVFNHFKELQRLYGNVYRIYVGPTLMIHVTQPEDAQKVLAGNRIRDRGPYAMRPLKTLIGNGLVTSTGDYWKAHRKIIEQCFHSDVLKQFMDAYNEGAYFLCERLEAQLGSAVELYGTLCLVAMRTIAASAFGLPFEEMEPDRNKQDEITFAFMTAIQTLQKRIFQPWMHYEWMVSMTADSKLLKQQIDVVDNLVKRAITFKKATRNTVGIQKKRALLDTLLEPDAQMTEEEIFDEIRTFLAAGTETTAGALGFALALLALYPEWQTAAQREVDAVFATGGDYLRPCTSEDVGRLKVIECIIKETLRLYPTVPIPVALMTEDTPLDGGRYVAPRGSYVSVALFLLHRQPHLFPDPEKFDPGRFMTNEDSIKHSYSYLPFGAGPRRCVGGRFAIFEMKTVLATVLRRFRVLPVTTREELDNVLVSISSQPASGCKVICVHRENRTSCGAK